MRRVSYLASIAIVLAGCDDLCRSKQLPRCDTREPACHAQVQAVVACMREETSSELPSIEVISLDEYEAYLRAGADPMMMRALEWETSLEMLGLLAPTGDLFEQSIAGSLASVSAFYSPAAREVFVIDRGMPMDSVEAVSTLAHELVHAAQDEEHDLTARLRAARTHEEVMVLRSIVEGEATFYTFEAEVWDFGAKPDDIDWPRFYDEWIGETTAAVAASPSPYLGVYSTYPYMLGGRWQTSRWELGGDAHVRAGIRNPPPSAAWLMVDPWRDGRAPPARAPAPLCDAPPPPEGFEPAGRDEMGAPLVATFLQRWRMTRAEAWDLAMRWARDDLFVYGAPDGSVALAWRVVLGDAQAPRWIATHLDNEAPGRFRVGHVEDTLVLLTSSDRAALDAWTWEAPSTCAPPP